ncbi:hypothetical protein H1R20_g1225, partial [Candolleomyces eurysporus]
MCTYCHRRPKFSSKEQCGRTCADKAKRACLLCKTRPKNKKYHFCGKTCKNIATKSTPLILEIPKGHVTYDMVENKFKGGWKVGTPPAITKIFKVIENDTFLKPYDAYRILKTSYKVEVAAQGTFGKGVYTSSASSMSFGFCGAGGAMLLNKVVLGKSVQVSSGLSSCPAGYDSVVYDSQGASNETIVYSNDALRPVFMIMFQ